MNNMIDLNWSFPSLQHPLTPPKPPEYLDYALKVAAEIKGGLTNQPYKTQSATEDALL